MDDSSVVSALRKTPLHAVHLASGARMTDFGGWDMPVEYSGITTEHMAVRTAVGVFDVSHMGEIEIRGPQALDLVNYVTSNDAANLIDGQVQYSGLLFPNAAFVDDILIHQIGPTEFFLCVNASNQEKDYEWIASQNSFEADVELSSDRYVQFAIQGPKSLSVLAKLTDVRLDLIRYYHFTWGQIFGIEALIARTGYTGEDGFEIYVPPQEGPRLWTEILSAGAEFGVKPCGLGARNTLRLEAAMSLYGHEIDDTITPFEARLGWIVKLEQGDFIGRNALIEQKRRGVERRLAGFEMYDRGIARDGYRVFVNDQDVGWVTSGSPAPFLGKNIGLCMLPAGMVQMGRTIEVEVRQKRVVAKLTNLPFYARKK